ncbi:uncharacterized protein MELLADRAFT_61042 [Melampsora larici-populina 98AG31]|uniref:Tet-like 2OG-Fe(II) oxygenase domain-containing protein n=1 Tax=Melampsora larici-populina (strain 98AG31 / pathotype 3-4-7) TaxID=747676 RepID=F4RDD3_MELLP|nr:uncharacterized protein MELLADRAFT_61042 [Melampsora larici-populina 98AG31]EGG09382.1 hypothetical protein MELLADRAFT_61042 [Melampsora larici-populina 98AG31]
MYAVASYQRRHTSKASLTSQKSHPAKPDAINFHIARVTGQELPPQHPTRYPAQPARPNKQSSDQVDINHDPINTKDDQHCNIAPVSQNSKRRKKAIETYVTYHIGQKPFYHSVCQVFKETKFSTRAIVKLANQSSTFTCYKGLCIITDRNNGAIIAIIKFTPFDSMSQDELEELKEVLKYLVEEKIYCNPVTLNAAMKGGYMGVIGWRAAFMTLEYYGMY